MGSTPGSKPSSLWIVGLSQQLRTASPPPQKKLCRMLILATSLLFLARQDTLSMRQLPKGQKTFLSSARLMVPSRRCQVRETVSTLMIAPPTLVVHLETVLTSCQTILVSASQATKKHTTRTTTRKFVVTSTTVVLKLVELESVRMN